MSGDVVRPAEAAPGISDFGSVVRARRRALGLSLGELAARVGRAKSYLSALENGLRRTPREPVLEALERALGLAPGQLLDAARWERTPALIKHEVEALTTDQRRRDGLARRLTEILAGSTTDTDGRIRGSLDEAYQSGELRKLVDRLAPEEEQRGQGAEIQTEGIQPLPRHSDTRRGESLLPSSLSPSCLRPFVPSSLPLINRVAAGYPREFTDLGYPARVADEYVRCPDISDPDAFAARVVGDSMQPRYEEGDVVVFSPLRQVTDGCDCFARLEPDHETTFKRVYFETDDGGRELVRLQPLNSAFAPRVLEREQVAALYAAVSVIKKV